LKAKVYKDRPLTVEELKEQVRVTVRIIDKDLLQVVMVNIRSQLQECIGSKGDLLRDAVFKR
jgi:hypothetical protein